MWEKRRQRKDGPATPLYVCKLPCTHRGGAAQVPLPVTEAQVSLCTRGYRHMTDTAPTRPSACRSVVLFCEVNKQGRPVAYTNMERPSRGAKVQRAASRWAKAHPPLPNRSDAARGSELQKRVFGHPPCEPQELKNGQQQHGLKVRSRSTALPTLQGPLPYSKEGPSRSGPARTPALSS